jgi:hypothetical protein
MKCGVGEEHNKLHKAQRLIWFGQLHRMPDERMVKKCISGD